MISCWSASFFNIKVGFSKCVDGKITIIQNAKKITPEKNNVLPASRSSESISVNSGNKSITTSTNSQNNTFKVRRDTSYYTGSAPITTDIPIFREEFLEHNKV